MEQRLVGILLNAAAHEGIPRGRTGWESLERYEEAAAAFGLRPCFIKLSDLDPASGYCMGYLKSSRGYHRSAIPIPGVIHNRAIYPPESSATMRLAAAGIRVFNLHTRYAKDEIHRLLESDPGLRGHLPDTETGTAGLAGMMERHKDIILKPRRGSVGKGIMRLQRGDNGDWRWDYYLRGRKESAGFEQGRIPLALLHRIETGAYLVQERIPLAEANGRPFDLRITVQRGWGGGWGVTGLFAKLAPPGGFVSNIARGGEAAEASTAMEKVFRSRDAALYRMHAIDLALKVVRCLEQSLPGLADVGLDIAPTRDGRLFFIECNGRDQRYGFFKAGQHEVWRETYRRPMGYARYLLEGADKEQRY